MQCEAEARGRLHLGNAAGLPFPDDSFRAAISVNTIHNLDAPAVVQAVREMQRIVGARGLHPGRLVSDAGTTRVFMDWVLTAKTHDYPDGWKALFEEAGYTGDYYWTIIE